MDPTTITWPVARRTIGHLTELVSRLRVYGAERVPAAGGVVLALNHLSWLDAPAFGVASPRTVYYAAKIEAHRTPAFGTVIRALGAFPVRRGESDREAVRLMRETVRSGRALGLFVEGTRQRAGVLGGVQPGAAMVSIRESAPVVAGVVYGSQWWRLGNFAPVSVAWSEPLRFDGLPANGRGYREASGEIAAALGRLWSFLEDAHRNGRPRELSPPCTSGSDLEDRSPPL